MAEVSYALSLKQPWATLLARGLKSIEVRRWSTTRTGRVLIHAARVSDTRPEAWRHLPPEYRAEAEIVGGFIGRADLKTCVPYPTLADFVRDQELHLNDPSWFEPGLFGFQFTAPNVIPFRRYAGWMRFFPVDEAVA